MGSNRIKNITLFGHTGSGKSSLTEGLLATTGKQVPRTQLKAYTQSTAFTCHYKDEGLVFIDTPGNANFSYDSQVAAHIGDNAILSLCADEAHSFQTEKAAQLIQRSTMPSILFINKMDVEAADFEATITAIKQNILLDPALIFLPIGTGANFCGLIDVVNEQALYFKDNGEIETKEIPEDRQQQAFLALQKLMEQVAETDDELIEEFLEEGELDPDDLRSGLRQAVLSCALTPVLPGAAKKRFGLSILLELIHQLFAVADDDSTELQAQIFRLDHNPEHGALYYAMVKSGSLTTKIHNLSRHCDEQATALYIPDGDELIPAQSIPAGMIGVLSGLNSSAPGDTLAAASTGEPLAELPRPPQANTTCAVQTDHSDQDEMFTALAMAISEDPSLHLEHQPQTGETLLGGQGRYHLETACRKIEEKFGTTLHLKLPKVPYKDGEQPHDSGQQLMEPIMNLTITLPVDSVGAVISDLNDRRAKIMEMKTEAGQEVIVSQVPMAEILEFGTDLARLTEGRGTVTSQLSHYQQLPAELSATMPARFASP